MEVRFEQVSKVFDQNRVLADLDLSIPAGDFLVLLGPSGCGKTTALRIAAGLEVPTGGRFFIGDRDVTELPPRARDIAMVFQSYALYPHLKVRDNIGYPLRVRKQPKDQISREVEWVATALGLDAYLDRKPRHLSGGQRQRVALARAIIRNPAAFLMDEPLSNLDAKLRVQMRAEILRIQKRLKVSTMYVTHDQVEAMTMGDRVAVMRSGVLQQCDHPQVLYNRPDNLFVAAFIGSPAMNLYEATVGEGGRSVRLGSQLIRLPEAIVVAHSGLAAYAGRSVVLGLRPEHLPAAGGGTAGPTLIADVELVEALGAELVVHFTIDARRIRPEGATDADTEAVTEAGEGVARIDPGAPVKPGERATFAINADGMQFFDPASGEAIWGHD